MFGSREPVCGPPPNRRPSSRRDGSSTWTRRLRPRPPRPRRALPRRRRRRGSARGTAPGTASTRPCTTCSSWRPSRTPTARPPGPPAAGGPRVLRNAPPNQPPPTSPHPPNAPAQLSLHPTPAGRDARYQLAPRERRQVFLFVFFGSSASGKSTAALGLYRAAERSGAARTFFVEMDALLPSSAPYFVQSRAELPLYLGSIFPRVARRLRVPLVRPADLRRHSGCRRGWNRLRRRRSSRNSPPRPPGAPPDAGEPPADAALPHGPRGEVRAVLPARRAPGAPESAPPKDHRAVRWRGACALAPPLLCCCLAAGVSAGVVCGGTASAWFVRD